MGENDTIFDAWKKAGTGAAKPDFTPFAVKMLEERCLCVPAEANVLAEVVNQFVDEAEKLHKKCLAANDPRAAVRRELEQLLNGERDNELIARVRRETFGSGAEVIDKLRQVFSDEKEEEEKIDRRFGGDEGESKTEPDTKTVMEMDSAEAVLAEGFAAQWALKQEPTECLRQDLRPLELLSAEETLAKKVLALDGIVKWLTQNPGARRKQVVAAVAIKAARGAYRGIVEVRTQQRILELQAEKVKAATAQAKRALIDEIERELARVRDYAFVGRIAADIQQVRAFQRALAREVIEEDVWELSKCLPRVIARKLVPSITVIHELLWSFDIPDSSVSIPARFLGPAALAIYIDEQTRKCLQTTVDDVRRYGRLLLESAGRTVQEAVSRANAKVLKNVECLSVTVERLRMLDTDGN